ncbi:metal ABC transporter substrate-binding protein [Brachybacterium hainanense]|uniref:Metal ABC transporter substrate-binding protein n=1 Tax=Brachybacterium hainanense TaxID=1541174 RepID=A0ABV6RCV8_9MICO
MSSSAHPSASRPSALLGTPLRRRSALGLGLAAAATALAACSGRGGPGSGKPTVVTGTYTLSYLVASVGGDLVEQIDLAKPGVDPHGLELSVAEVGQLQSADLVIAIPGFQAAIDDALASHGEDNALLVDSVITLLPADAAAHDHGASDGGGEHEDEHGSEHDGEEHHDHGDTDPHFWHDPSLMADVGDAVAARLAEIVPDSAATFTENAAALRTTLEDLDAELRTLFDAVPGEKPFVTSHTAFAYLAHRYGLEQIGITGVDPEVEPSPQRLLALETVIQDEGVTTVFFETTASPKVAETLAANLGIQAAELDNLETQLDPEVDYPAVMRTNAQALASSWQ